MTIKVQDDAGTFTPEDVQTLRNASAKWPFDIHLFSTNTMSKSALENRVHEAVDNPNVIAIGLDPKHKKVVVHFGRDVGVTPSQWKAISSSGNSSFKDGNWVDGVLKIAEKTVSLRTQTQTGQPNPVPTPVPETSSGSNAGWWIFGAVALGVLIFFWWRNKRRQEEHDEKIEELESEIAEKRARNVEEAAWSEKFKSEVRPPARSYSAPVPAPLPPRPAYSSPVVSSSSTTVVVNQNSGGGGNDLMTGYMLGSMASRRDRVIDREVVVEREVISSRRRYDSDSDDSGGTSSSWDQPSYSSGNDSGGSSSSFGDDDDFGGSNSSFGDDDD